MEAHSALHHDEIAKGCKQVAAPVRETIMMLREGEAAEQQAAPVTTKPEEWEREGVDMTPGSRTDQTEWSVIQMPNTQKSVLGNNFFHSKCISFHSWSFLKWSWVWGMATRPQPWRGLYITRTSQVMHMSILLTRVPYSTTWHQPCEQPLPSWSCHCWSQLRWRKMGRPERLLCSKAQQSSGNVWAHPPPATDALPQQIQPHVWLPDAEGSSPERALLQPSSRCTWIDASEAYSTLSARVPKESWPPAWTLESQEK